MSALVTLRVARPAVAAFAGRVRVVADAAAIPAGAGRVPFNAAAADILSEFEPAVVSFHFGLPAPELVARVRSWGAKVLASATTVEEALWLQARGVDAIIAQGLEAGGHRGIFLSDDLTTQVGTFALLPQIVNAVTIPVIALSSHLNDSTSHTAFRYSVASIDAEVFMVGKLAVRRNGGPVCGNGI